MTQQRQFGFGPGAAPGQEGEPRMGNEKPMGYDMTHNTRYRAYRVIEDFIGTTSIVAEWSIPRAITACQRSAKEAGDVIPWTRFSAKRAPEYDAWAATTKHRGPVAESVVKMEMQPNCPAGPNRVGIERVAGES